MRARRTTISCVMVVFLLGLSTTASAAIRFPLAVRWTAALAAPPAFAPGFDSEFAYIPLRTNQLVALSLADGQTAWSIDCTMTAAPVAGEGLVFAGSDGLVEAVAQLDGRARWHRPVPGRVMRLHLDTGWLLVSTENGPLLALRASDGQVLWQRDLGSPLSASPVPAGERLYVPLSDGRILALSLLTGEDIWTHALEEAAVGVLPVGDHVFVGALDNQFHALRARNGSTDWRWRTGADLIGTPALDARRVYFIALDNVLRGHRRGSGWMDWKRVLPMRPFSGPLLSGELLIVAGVAAELRAYHTLDGSDAGAITVKGAENEEMLLAAPPHLAQNDLVILVTRGGQVRALGHAPAAESPPSAMPADAGQDAQPSPPLSTPAPTVEPAPPTQ